MVDWEPVELAGVCPQGTLGVTVPSGLVGAIYTQSNSDFIETPYFEKIGRFFWCACGYVVNWPHVAQVRFWRPKTPHLESSHVVWQSPSSWEKKKRKSQKKLSAF